MSMNSTARGPRSRWVGPPVPAPKSKLSRSPFGRQRHYGAVELAGAGEQVNVNDVVEVTDNKQQQQETSQQHPVLVQVLSMWEDTFTGVFKFRARWLVQASDLPEDSLPRLRTSRHASEGDRSVTGSKTPSNKEQHEADEVFLSNRVKDLEVRSIVKPITLCVSASATTDLSPGGKGKMGPRLTQAFCDKSGDFHPLDGTDPILKRARVRQANAVALASRAVQENEAAKSGKPMVKSNGWLLPKRGTFQGRGRRDGAREARCGVDIVESSSNSAARPLSPPKIDIEGSDDSGTEEPPNSDDGEWKEGEEDDDDDATDSDSPRNSNTILSNSEEFKPRKSARQRKSQRSPHSDAAPASHAAPAAHAEGGGSPEAKVDPSEAQVEDSCEAHTEGGSDMQLEDSSEGQAEDSSEAEVEDDSEEKVFRRPSTFAPTFQRLRRVSANKRRGPLPPRPRRLAMPPMAEEPLIAHVSEVPPHTSAKASVAVKVARPVRTRMSMGLRPKSTLALPRSSSMEDAGKASPQLSTAAKRKRGGAAKTTQGANRSDYPPLRTPVGKDYQTDIPDLLFAEERKQPHTGTGAKMVWRSIQDWDPQSRGMLAGYLHAAKGVVEAKQARPGVAVHVRLGGKKSNSDVSKEDNTGIAGSYAVWAVSSGREACGLVRVACSEMAQTDIPKSAIQRVQSQEQALSALVRARCVLDNFEPALQMLANDPGSPESIEPWTIKQVRTLETALAKDYDPSRRLHGWARPGMDMDREDFIDLAAVSEQVPGKTPTQVLSFYYKYLAAAEPLTDVVYGPKAAKARQQECISPANEADAGLPSNGRLTKDNARTTKPKTPARQASPAPRRASPASTPTNATESAPKPKPRVIRLSAPKPVEPVVGNTERKDGTPVDSVPKDDRSKKRDSSPPANDKVSFTPEATPTPTPHPAPMSKHAIAEATLGGDGRPAEVDHGTGREEDMFSNEGGGHDGASEQFAHRQRCAVREREVSRILPPAGGDDRPADTGRRTGGEADRLGDEGGDRGGASEQFDRQRRCAVRDREFARTLPLADFDDRNAEADPGTDREAGRLGDESGDRGGAGDLYSQQQRCAARERGVSRVLPPVPPDAEVLEVEDSDDADAGGATHNSGVWATGGGEPTRPSDVKAAARRVNLTGSAGISWVARQMRRQASPALEPESRRSGVQQMPPRSALRHSDIVEGQRKGGSDAARYDSRSEAPGFQNAKREPRWEQPTMSHSIRHEEHVRRFDDRHSGAQVESVGIGSSGVSGPGYSAQINDGMGSEPASTDYIFGSMAPCWRLLERAQAYMDKDQLEYMRGLVLTHARKPMSRDQLLERAESCLQEQDKIFAAFVKMFDRIDQPPQVPLYPKKRALQPRPQSMSYSVRRSPDAGPIHVSPHGLTPPQVPPPRTVNAQERGPHSLRLVHDVDERGVPMSGPTQPYSRVAVLARDRVEVRRSIHPYDHNGASGWPVAGVGSRGRNDAADMRAEPPPRRLSPGPYPSELTVNPAGYQEGRSDAGHGGGSRMRKAWSQQPPGDWKTETASSAAPAAAIPGSISRRASRGPAWGGGGAGAWS